MIHRYSMAHLKKTPNLWVLMTLVLSMSWLIVATAAPGSGPDSGFPVFIQVYDMGITDTVIFADRTSSSSNGNWVKLSGEGTTVNLPLFDIFTDALTSSSTTVNGVNIDILSLLTSKQFIYPFSSHQVFTQGNSVSASFYGDRAFSGDSGLTWRLISTNQGGLGDALDDVTNGDTSSIKSLLSSGNSVWEQNGITLDNNGDAMISFVAPTPNSYLLALLSESNNPYRLVIYGFTMINVADYELEKTIESSNIISGDFFDLILELSGSPKTLRRTYGIVLIRENVYDFKIRYSRLPDIALTLNDELIFDESGYLLGTTLNPQEITLSLRNIFGAGNVAIGISQETLLTRVFMAASTKGLNIGEYKAVLLVWETEAETRLTAIDVLDVTVYTPGAEGDEEEGDVLPSADQIDSLGPLDAYDLLKDLSGDQIAQVLEDVNVTKSSLIFPFFSETQVLDILGRLSPSLVDSILSELGDQELVELFLILSVEQISILENYIAFDINRAALIIDKTVKQINQYIETEKNQALNDLGLILGELEHETLMSLLIKIAELPETPSVAAELLMNLSPEVSVNITKTWIISEKTLLLSQVFDSFTFEHLDFVYRALSSVERLKMYPFWSSKVVSALPQLGVFRVNEILINPIEPETGEDVSIDVKIVNVGEETDDIYASLIVDGVSRDQYLGILTQGQEVSLSFIGTYVEPGNYFVQVLANSTFFTVVSGKPVMPGKIEVTSVQVIPDPVLNDGGFTVNITVSNLGDIAFTGDLDVFVDSELVSSQSVTIQSNVTLSIAIDLNLDLETGQHMLKVGVSEISFQVQGKTILNPSLMLLGILLVLVFTA